MGYTTSIMTAKDFCDIVRYRKKQSGFGRNGSGKGKKMFKVIHPSHFYLESLRSASLDHKEERGFGFVCSDKNKLERNTVVKDAVLS